MWTSSGTCGRGSKRGEGQAGWDQQGSVPGRAQDLSAQPPSAPWPLGRRTDSLVVQEARAGDFPFNSLWKVKPACAALVSPSMHMGGIVSCALCSQSRQFLPTCWALTQHQEGPPHPRSRLGMACGSHRAQAHFHYMLSIIKNMAITDTYFSSKSYRIMNRLHEV